jgi:hypothetical protein
MSDEPPLTSEERQRRAVQLCGTFMSNLGFHRAGMKPEVQRALFAPTHPQEAFWREAHVNFIDMCVLEWCKLFTDRTAKEWGKHHWRRVVAEPHRFEAELYTTLGVTTAAEFADLIAPVRKYRDKFVAHLDEVRVMHWPTLDQPMKAVEFLFERLAREARSHHEDWQRLRLPTTVADLNEIHALAFQQAQSVYAEAMDRRSALRT